MYLAQVGVVICFFPFFSFEFRHFLYRIFQTYFAPFKLHNFKCVRTRKLDAFKRHFQKVISQPQ